MNLYKHQSKIVEEDKKWCLLGLGCGSGKTRTALALAEGDTIVICEKQQREDKTWERELEKCGKELQLTVISKEDFRLNKFEPRMYDTVILDEATWAMGVRSTERQKNYKKFPDTSKIFTKMRAFINIVKPKRFYMLTATIQKTPLTVFAGAVLLNKISFNDYHKFREKYYFKLPMNKWVDIYKVKQGTEKELAKFTQSLGYVGCLNDYFDVPDQTYVTKKVDLTADQKRCLKDVLLDYPEPTVQNAKRHQVENGILIGNEFLETVEVKDNKIDVVKNYAVEFPQMIVVAKWTSQINKLKKEFPEAYVLNGQTKNRDELFEKLRKKDKYILIVQAGISKGWELKKCPAIVFLSNDYKWEDFHQMHGRVQRADHIKKNIYINVVTSYNKSMDNRVLKALEIGDDFNDALYSDNNK